MDPSYSYWAASSQAAIELDQKLFEATRQAKDPPDLAGLEAIERLLRQGANPNAPAGPLQSTAFTAFALAAQKNRADLIERFSAHARPVADYGIASSPLDKAILSHSLDALAALLKCGADPAACVTDHYGPFHTAIHEGDLDALALMAPFSRRAPWALLEVCGLGESSEALACAQILLPYADLGWIDAEGRTPLMRAADYGHDSLVELLLPLSDLEAVDENDMTALDMSRGSTKALLEKAALERASSHGSVPAVKPRL